MVIATLNSFIYQDLYEGLTDSIVKRLENKDIQLFAYISGDVNPAHLDPEFAKQTLFHQVIGHGMWSASLISAVLGTKLPGPGTVYLEQTVKFLKPVTLGDIITATVTVKEKRPHNHVLFDCRCTNQEGEEVLTGEALVLAPTEKIRREAMPLPEVELKTPHE